MENSINKFQLAAISTKRKRNWDNFFNKYEWMIQNNKTYIKPETNMQLDVMQCLNNTELKSELCVNKTLNDNKLAQYNNDGTRVLSYYKLYEVQYWINTGMAPCLADVNGSAKRDNYIEPTRVGSSIHSIITAEYIKTSKQTNANILARAGKKTRKIDRSLMIRQPPLKKPTAVKPSHSQLVESSDSENQISSSQLHEVNFKMGACTENKVLKSEDLQQIQNKNIGVNPNKKKLVKSKSKINPKAKSLNYTFNTMANKLGRDADSSSDDPVIETVCQSNALHTLNDKSPPVTDVIVNQYSISKLESLHGTSDSIIHKSQGIRPSFKKYKLQKKQKADLHKSKIPVISSLRAICSTDNNNIVHTPTSFSGTQNASNKSTLLNNATEHEPRNDKLTNIKRPNDTLSTAIYKDFLNWSQHTPKIKCNECALDKHNNTTQIYKQKCGTIASSIVKSETISKNHPDLSASKYYPVITKHKELYLNKLFHSNTNALRPVSKDLTNGDATIHDNDELSPRETSFVLVDSSSEDEKIRYVPKK